MSSLTRAVPRLGHRVCALSRRSRPRLALVIRFRRSQPPANLGTPLTRPLDPEVSATAARATPIPAAPFRIEFADMVIRTRFVADTPTLHLFFDGHGNLWKFSVVPDLRTSLRACKEPSELADGHLDAVNAAMRSWMRDNKLGRYVID